MILGDLIKKYRQEHGCSMDQFAKMTGLSKAYISILERNVNPVNNKPVIPSLETIKAVAQAINMDFNDVISMLDGNQPVSLTEEADIPPGFQPMPAMVEVPLVGRIACGSPILAEENIERMVCVPEKWHATFTLTCEGSSMEPKIHDGDLVAIRSQPTVENGEVAAVRIEGDATLKRVYLHDSFIELRAENPSFESIILAKEEMNTVVIEGKAVGLCRDI